LFLLVSAGLWSGDHQSSREEHTRGGPQVDEQDFNEGRTRDRQWAILLATNGQLHDRPWAGSHGRRHRGSVEAWGVVFMSLLADCWVL